MELLPIRLSHLLGHSGVGAIVRGPHGLVVVQDIRNWTDRSGHPAGIIIPYVERVRVALEITEELREPPLAKALGSGHIDGTCIPVTRFPFWMRCPNQTCGALYFKPWKKQGTDRPHCQHCQRKPELEQVAWVVINEDGCLADVPWHFLAHRDVRAGKQQQCKIENRLRLVDHGYSDRELRCEACGAQTKFHGNERVGFWNTPMQPWSRDPAPNPDGNAGTAQVARVNEARVFTPQTDKALKIPPESRLRKGTVVDRLYNNSTDRERIDKAHIGLQRRSVLRALATTYRCGADDIERALADIDNGYPQYGATFTPGLLRESEYDAFQESVPDRHDDEDLVPHDRSREWRELVARANVNKATRGLAECIPTLIRVDRLTAVKVLLGFTRLRGQTVKPDIVGKSAWLPAVELHGEGLFITLDERRLAAWEQSPAVVARLHQLLPRFQQSGRAMPNPLTARFMLLHTLSHLLMRQIEAEAGYPGAALEEWLYCAATPTPMAGILISVTVPDIAGSLGGLAELAEPERFLPLLVHALDHARWCSLDPVCSEHEGQGPGLLNRAACHACALVPEPACDYGNTLLDRVFVKGDAANGVPSLFAELPM